MAKRYYIAESNGGFIGIECTPVSEYHQAKRDCPIEGLKFRPVAQDYYECTVLDLRYEDGVWQQ